MDDSEHIGREVRPPGRHPRRIVSLVLKILGTLIGLVVLLQLYALWQMIEEGRQIITIRRLRTVLTAVSLDQSERWKSTCPPGAITDEIVDLTRFRILPPDEVERLVIRLRLDPEKLTDPWGHPFQFALPEGHGIDSSTCLVVRSAGKDESFTGDRYVVGSYPHDDLEQDMVVVHGYFARWPSAVGPHDAGLQTPPERTRKKIPLFAPTHKPDDHVEDGSKGKPASNP
ncbi:MAG: hypothetical protein AAGM22_21645 [Acidobacteriota bacterium]